MNTSSASPNGRNFAMHGLDLSPWLRLLLIGALFLSSLAALAMPVHAEDGVVVVRAGDTLSNIAQAYGVSASELAASNGVSNQNLSLIHI